MGKQNSPIDFDKALKITDNDIDLFESLMDIFLEVKSEYILDIRNAISAQNAQELQITAHRAKSGFVSIGATIASELAYKMELMGENSVFDNIERVIKAFEEELDMIEDYVINKKWIDKG